jgi:hypothetical protein
MNYREYLATPLSKLYVDQLVEIIYRKPTDFRMVYDLVFDEEIKVAWRAAWACQKISEKYPEWFSETDSEKLITLTMSTSQSGLQRGCLATLYNIVLPNPVPVEFINACFEWMVSPRYPVAVQVYSMKMLYKICRIEPDFIPELRAYLENLPPEDYSAGFNATRRNILKLLNSNHKTFVVKN